MNAKVLAALLALATLASAQPATSAPVVAMDAPTLLLPHAHMRALAGEAGFAIMDLPAPPTGHALPSRALAELVDRHGATPSPEALSQMRSLDALGASQRDALTRFLNAYLSFDAASRAAYARSDPARLERLLETGGQTEPGVLPKALAWAGVDLAPILHAQAPLLTAAQGLRLAFPPSALPVGAAAQATCTPTAQYRLVFSIDLASCDNVYTEDYALVIDVGGNDRHLNNAGGNNVNFPTCSLLTLRAYGYAAALVDLAGNDVYGTHRGCGTNGGGALGSGFLFDASGDDLYQGGHYGTNGGGALGVGTLIDLGGNDQYTAWNGGANGAGNLGLGFLYDASGTDVYRDDEGGSGTDLTLTPKGSAGAQVDGTPAPQTPTTDTVRGVYTFESGPQGWTHGGSADDWELGLPTYGVTRAASGVKAWGTRLDGQMESGQRWLLSPIFELNPYPVLHVRWRDYLDLYRGSYGACDSYLNPATCGELQIRIVGDSGWRTISKIEPSYTGGWTQRQVQIIAGAGAGATPSGLLVQVRFHLDAGGGYAGWYVDEVELPSTTHVYAPGDYHDYDDPPGQLLFMPIEATYPGYLYSSNAAFQCYTHNPILGSNYCAATPFGQSRAFDVDIAPGKSIRSFAATFYTGNAPVTITAYDRFSNVVAQTTGCESYQYDRYSPITPARCGVQSSVDFGRITISGIYEGWLMDNAYFQDVGPQGALDASNVPSTPLALGAVPGPRDREITIAWAPPVDPGAGAHPLVYRVYRGTSPDAVTTWIADVEAVTAYTDKHRDPAITYYYAVSAKNARGEGAPFHPVSANAFGVVDGPHATITPNDQGDLDRVYYKVGLKVHYGSAYGAVLEDSYDGPLPFTTPEYAYEVLLGADADGDGTPASITVRYRTSTITESGDVIHGDERAELHAVDPDDADPSNPRPQLAQTWYTVKPMHDGNAYQTYYKVGATVRFRGVDYGTVHEGTLGEFNDRDSDLIPDELEAALCANENPHFNFDGTCRGSDYAPPTVAGILEDLHKMTP